MGSVLQAEPVANHNVHPVALLGRAAASMQEHARETDLMLHSVEFHNAVDRDAALCLACPVAACV